MLRFIAGGQDGRFFRVSELVRLNNALRLRALILRHNSIDLSPELQRALTQPHQVGCLVPSRATGDSFVIIL